jgi:hypothetical protein
MGEFATFNGYLEINEVAGIIDFHLRIVRGPDGLDFYIHPQGKDGLTGDFTIINGNLVLPIEGGRAAGSRRKRHGPLISSTSETQS